MREPTSISSRRYRLLAAASTVALLSAAALPAAARLDEALRHDLEASGRVDSELLTALAERDRVGVIAVLDVRDDSGAPLERFRSAAARGALRTVADRLVARSPGIFDLVHRYSGVNALAVTTDAAGLLELLSQPEVSEVGLDVRMEWSLSEALPVAGVSTVRRDGKHGKGVWVAVLDSGTDRAHRDIKKPLKREECFCGPSCCPDGSDRQSGRGSAQDDVGHGTLTSGAIVSRGRVAPRGAAFKAKLLMIKMGDEVGPKSSDALASLDYVLTEMPEVRVVSMSFGTSKTWKGNCDKKGAVNRAYSAAISALRDNGVLVFASSGNGATPGGMGSPACVKHAISVGASYDADFGEIDLGICLDETTAPNELVCFTDRSAKTDLVAPGFAITLPALGGGVSSVIGTSFAAPIAAGCAVLVRKTFPDATVEEIEQAFAASPTQVVDPVNGRTYPALDCEAAFDFLSSL